MSSFSMDYKIRKIWVVYLLTGGIGLASFDGFDIEDGQKGVVYEFKGD